VSDTIRASHLIETPVKPEQAAEAIAGEQSSGTFVKLGGETDPCIARHGARVEACEVLGEAATPAFPGAKASATGRYTRATLRIAWPLDNVGPSLPNLLATVAGNLNELAELSGIRLLDVELPESLIRALPGPQFGVAGTRRLAGVERRPLIGTIIKPSVGL
jgi:ribulose-bisphosphate carboxylase large chain